MNTEKVSTRTPRKKKTRPRNRNQMVFEKLEKWKEVALRFSHRQKAMTSKERRLGSKSSNTWTLKAVYKILSDSKLSRCMRNQALRVKKVTVPCLCPLGQMNMLIQVDSIMALLKSQNPWINWCQCQQDNSRTSNDHLPTQSHSENSKNAWEIWSKETLWQKLISFRPEISMQIWTSQLYCQKWWAHQCRILNLWTSLDLSWGQTNSLGVPIDTPIWNNKCLIRAKHNVIWSVSESPRTQTTVIVMMPLITKEKPQGGSVANQPNMDRDLSLWYLQLNLQQL